MSDKGVLMFAYSGGTVNSDPLLSVGGAISSNLIHTNNAAWEGTSVPGITLLGGAGNPLGIGSLNYDKWHSNIGRVLWQAPGETSWYTDGAVVFYSNNSDVFIESAQTGYTDDIGEDPVGILTLEIDESAVPSAIQDRFESISITENYLHLFPDVTPEEAYTGVTRYRAVYVKLSSRSSKPVNTMSPLFIKDTMAGDVISFGWSAEAKNTTIEQLTNEFTAPTGVEFFDDLLDSDVSTRTLGAAGDYMGLWVRQTVKPRSTALVKDNLVEWGVYVEEEEQYALMDIIYSLHPHKYDAVQKKFESGMLTPLVTYSIVLTGVNDSLPDLPLVANKASITKDRISGISTVSISALTGAIDIAEVNARENGTLKITQTIAYTDSIKLTTVLSDYPMASSIVSKGGRSRTTVLPGYEAVLYDNPSDFGSVSPSEIAGKLIVGGNIIVTAVSPYFASTNPGDTLTVMGVGIVVDFVEISLNSDSIAIRMTQSGGDL